MTKIKQVQKQIQSQSQPLRQQVRTVQELGQATNVIINRIDLSASTLQRTAQVMGQEVEKMKAYLAILIVTQTIIIVCLLMMLVIQKS